MDLEQVIRKYALQNALQFDGKATMGAVLGKVMAENAELRVKAKEVSGFAKSIITEVNKMSVEDQRKALEDLAPELLVKEVKHREMGLPDLKDVTGEVRMRMAPIHQAHFTSAIAGWQYSMTSMSRDTEGYATTGSRTRILLG